jgi:Co/Zn/Cd efflux system component
MRRRTAITTPRRGRRTGRLRWGATLNLGLVVVELGFGLVANSVALLADAAHNFADMLALLLGGLADAAAADPAAHVAADCRALDRALPGAVKAVVLFGSRAARPGRTAITIWRCCCMATWHDATRAGRASPMKLSSM